MENRNIKEVNRMKLLLVLNKNDMETVNSVFSLAMTASAADDEVSIFALGSGTQIFTKEKAPSMFCCDSNLEDIIADGAKIQVCLCVESEMCTIGEQDLISGVKIVDILELLQMIREYDRIITF